MRDFPYIFPVRVLLILVVGLVLLGRTCYGQQAQAPVRNNTLGVTMSLREFFDGSPIVQRPYPKTLRWMNLGFGLEYDRRIGTRHGFLVSATLNGNSYWYSPYPEKPGDIFFRVGFYAETCYQYFLVTTPKWSLSGLGGVNLRLGHEAVMIYRFSSEVTSSQYELRDVGLSAGLKGSRRLTGRLAVSGAMKFTQYLYRYALHQNLGIPYPNRPTSSLLTWQVGVGYRF